MGIEGTFIGILIICALTGMLHGYKRELGVTIVLALVVGLVGLVESRFGMQVNDAIGQTMNAGVIAQAATRGLIYAIVLLLVVFAAYQVNLFRFPGTNPSMLLGLSSGALNGYLLAGSLWYYLSRAGWPLVFAPGPFTELYRAGWTILPPNVVAWPLMLVFSGGLLILRMTRGRA